MKNISTKWYSIISGTIFLLLLLVILILIPCPSNVQLNFFRIFIAIAAASFAATIPGTIKFNNKIVAATSSIGVFVLIYLINPAGWNTGNCSLNNVKAIVYVDNKPTQGVEISILDMGQKFITNEYGVANIEYSSTQIKFPTKIVFKLKNQLDTIIEVKNQFKNKMEFNLQSSKKENYSFFNGSINYTFKDLSLNLSLSNQINPPLDSNDSEAEDYVTYSFKKSVDTIFIIPNSKLLNAIANNQVANSFLLMDDIENFEINLPQFDFKFTNNSTDAIYLNQMILSVQNSLPDNKALFVVGREKNFTLYNFGWGNAKNIQVDFSTAPINTELNWEQPFEEHIEPDEISAGDRISFQEFFVENLVKKGVDRKAFKVTSGSLSEESQKKMANVFSDGACIFGTITFSDNSQNKKVQKFKTENDVFIGEYADEFGFSSNYFNTELKSYGNDYSIKMPISKPIKPKDFDRFSLTLATNQSSQHCFRLSFWYGENQYLLPNIFKLEYFNGYGRKDYLKKQKA